MSVLPAFCARTRAGFGPRTTTTSILAAAFLLGTAPLGTTGAQQAGPPAGATVKTFTIARGEIAPVIDGLLDDEAWSNATVISDLHQIDPVEYAEPSQRTEIRIFYTDDALYVAARLFDTEADRITAQVLRQGEGLANEDRFAVILDPNLDRRSGYRFQVNPNSVRWEALYRDVSNLESDWSGIWRAAATRDERGWTAEMEIPFKTLSFDPGSNAWGINFERTIQRVDETLGWVSRNRQMNPGIAGTAVGFHGLRQGRGVDIVPSLSLTERRVFGTGVGGGSNLEPSLDVFYKVTPSLNAALTLNTDFSATEVDDRQVNLTRFSLFFPEKRDFFLQDADIFEFGRIGSGGGGGGPPGMGSGATQQNGRAFFSRRIGLSAAGQPVDIDYGGKLSGRAGRWNIGALAIRQAAHDELDSTDVFVGRVSANVLSESTAGIILTDGNPRANRDGTLVGADFLYRNTRLPGGRVLEGEVWYQRSDNEGISGDDRAFGFGLSSPNNVGWRGGASFKQIEANFDPAVGFVNQAGIRSHSVDVGHRLRFGDSYLRTVFGGLQFSRTERLGSGLLDSETVSLEFNGATAFQDRMFIGLNHNRQLLVNDFRIYSAPDGSRTVVIPAGEYSYQNMFVGLRTGNQRPIAAFVGLGAGEFFDGRSKSVRSNLNWRPSAHLRLGVSYDVQDISLPQGDFVVRIAALQAQFVFSSTLSWVNLIQYDNVSETAAINSRLHWIPQAGREGFIVINHVLSDADRTGSFNSLRADATLKFSYTWRL
jgi:hypothetical protein